MSERIYYELLLTALSLITGGWLMAVYDGFRFLRILIRHNSLFVGIEDFFYWIYAGTATFMLLYELNDGGVRMYAVAGVFTGMILYDKIVSRFLFAALKKAGKWFKIKRNR